MPKSPSPAFSGLDSGHAHAAVLDRLTTPTTPERLATLLGEDVTDVRQAIADLAAARLVRPAGTAAWTVTA